MPPLPNQPVARVVAAAQVAAQTLGMGLRPAVAESGAAALTAAAVATLEDAVGRQSQPTPPPDPPSPPRSQVVE